MTTNSASKNPEYLKFNRQYDKGMTLIDRIVHRLTERNLAMSDEVRDMDFVTDRSIDILNGCAVKWNQESKEIRKRLGISKYTPYGRQ